MSDNQARVALAHNVSQQYKTTMDAYARVHKQSCELNASVALESNKTNENLTELTVKKVHGDEGWFRIFRWGAARLVQSSIVAHRESTQLNKATTGAAHDANNNVTEGVLKSMRESEQEMNQLNTALARSMTATPTRTPLERMNDLVELRTAGLISDAEFDQKKARIIAFL